MTPASKHLGQARPETWRSQTSGPAPEAGMTLLELVIAVGVLSVGALATLGTMTTSAEVDEEMRERSIALRAAVSRLESIVAYDYDDDIQNLVTWAQLPANSSFTVDGLAPPEAAGGGPVLVANPTHGTVTVDAADPDRIRFIVTVSWSGRRGQRTLSVPTTVTEVLQ